MNSYSGGTYRPSRRLSVELSLSLLLLLKAVFVNMGGIIAQGL